MTVTTSSPQERWDADIPLPSPREDRPVTFMHRVEAAITRGVIGVCRRQPVDKAASRLGKLLRVIGPMIRPVHAKGHANLKLVYPDMTAAERAAILRGVWENLGAVAAEFGHLPQLASRTEIVNEERLRPFIDGEERAVFVSGHFANWEVMPATFFDRGLKYAFVYRAANNPIVDRYIIDIRSKAMSRHQIPKGKRGSRELVHATKDGNSICMLTDQKLNDGISVPLLGHPCMTAPAVARIALKEDMPVIPIQLVRNPGSRFTLTVHEPLDVERKGELVEDINSLTTAINDKLGEFIRHRPDQWLWFHRRWPRKLTG
ncbi:MAG: lysophospholipid acyltransferase family protein [Pseudomonadota bacterium]